MKSHDTWFTQDSLSGDLGSGLGIRRYHWLLLHPSLCQRHHRTGTVSLSNQSVLFVVALSNQSVLFVVSLSNWSVLFAHTSIPYTHACTCTCRCTVDVNRESVGLNKTYMYIHVCKWKEMETCTHIILCTDM